MQNDNTRLCVLNRVKNRKTVLAKITWVWVYIHFSNLFRVGALATLSLLGLAD
jgi:hypothetical protein